MIILMRFATAYLFALDHASSYMVLTSPYCERAVCIIPSGILVGGQVGKPHSSRAHASHFYAYWKYFSRRVFVLGLSVCCLYYILYEFEI